ncbi:MAG: Spy/CpxP family protein refolding chaperone [Acidobacteria bacterium]|nr:Spy/CpxP family protein refolding chaperone [Acidobacteriota bacterium]
MNSIYSILPLIALVLFGFIQSTFGQTSDASSAIPPPPPEFRGGPRPEGFGPRDAFNKLGLSDVQKQQIEILEVNSRELTEEQYKIVRSTDEQLRMMVESGYFSDESALRLIRVKTDAMSKIELVRLRIDAAIAKVLTTDQKTQLARFRTQRRPLPPGVDLRPDGR